MSSEFIVPGVRKKPTLDVPANEGYSTWLTGSVRAIDISDPANPVEVGWFVDGISFSDIALLGDDYVVATHVWDAGMVILRDESP